ncbi:putative histone deacetylase [Helianthus annuus]|uniref:histone deacetylase n=1 Tax=Helianthus annuus TaxID=4232 RepID=A0A9K3J8C6_HELAN|nr:putative histone deacetylase [Helianthus annuus]KAJ0581433.1 putative histone deacetylase [Helianthus annuus]KAJ0597379.1 putative histone deacetylase [Helianthus annuus]KAJ0758040.1 putative histone deacetylase [Helianthus annuus]KAJ0761713.1 putative histone deacetylase [Helianthus annuus]
MSECYVFWQFGSMGGEGYYVNVPWSRGGVRDNDYIFAFEHIVLPIGYLCLSREFAPDFTIISARFDATRGDPLGSVPLLISQKFDGPTPSSPPRRNYEITPRTPSASRGCSEIIVSADSFNRSSIGETDVHPLLTSLMQSVQVTNNHKRFSHSEVPLW